MTPLPDPAQAQHHDPATAADAAVRTILSDLSAVSSNGGRGVVVDSPPGAGKTTLVRRAAQELVAAGEQIMIIAQTNNQIDDLAALLAADDPALRIGRISGEEYANAPSPLEALSNVTIDTKIGNLQACEIVLGTAAKWARVKDHRRRWAIVDEAYQMRSDALLLVASQFDCGLFVGDPGQLDPFTIADTERWTGLAYDPRQNAVDVLLAHNRDTVIERTLPVSWRLPPSATTLIAPAFYPYNPFAAGTSHSARALTFTTAALPSPLDDTLEQARRTGWALHELPARHTQRTDSHIAAATAHIAARLLARGAAERCEHHPEERLLGPKDIAIGVVHRDQADQIRRTLPSTGVPGAERITVDTANRLQGREYEVVIVAHPLSGRRDATTFHLDAGRLCVLTTRHRHACIVVSRAGITDLLDAHPATDPIHLNVPVKFPDGWEAHHTVLHHLNQHRITAPSSDAFVSK
ncbi:AAA domain-containing protein [Actinoallomurus sp. NBC_01490]|uniref:AAA domain-containing protein n=1 Tax=Actinoallomurus sp. NBC_01490 TaxID=2903557 RepID=UPI002E36B634|nr:AAA domain-containing protein [Actinoallomurus sp. NBC_01490]